MSHFQIYKKQGHSEDTSDESSELNIINEFSNIRKN